MNLQRIIGRRLFALLARAVMRRAVRTPYTHLRHRDRTPYMDRFWLFRIGHSGKPNQRGAYLYPWLGARVHHIQSSDDDRALHNHPWPFLTLILRGSYEETQAAPWILKPGHPPKGWTTEDIGHTKVDVRRRTFSAGSLRYCRANTLHMLHVPAGGEAVTLFITFPMSQDWGFLFKRRLIPHDKFEHIGAGSGITVQHEPGGRLVID